MAEDKEIEIKWNAYSTERSKPVERRAFNKALRRYARGRKARRVSIAGFDYYYESKAGFVGRHRHGVVTNELTTKARISAKSTTVRAETNLRLAKSTSPLQVREFFLELGFPKVLPVYKDCDIYFIQEGRYTVDVVWYRVTCQSSKPRDFLEVEVQGGSVRESLSVLDRWKKFMYKEFGIGDADIVNESLYEIYSGKRYRMSARSTR
jgi:adenylate cyclase class IV